MDEYPDWMDYPSDNEEAIVLDPEKLISHDMEAEAELLNKYMKGKTSKAHIPIERPKHLSENKRNGQKWVVVPRLFFN